MPLSQDALDSIRLQYVDAQKIINAWIKVQDDEIEKFMKRADTFKDILAPDMQETKVKKHVEHFNDLRTRFLSATTESTKKQLRHEISDIVRVAQEEVSAAVQVAKAMPAFSVEAEYANEAEDALKQIADAKRKRSVILAVEEFFEVNQRLIENLVTFKIILEALAREFQEFQRPEIKTYLEQLDKVLLAYQDLRLMDCITQSESLAAVVLALQEKITKGLFGHYAESLSHLALCQESMQQRFLPYEKQIKSFIAFNAVVKDYLGSLGAYALIPMQHLTRLPLLMMEVKDQFIKASQLTTVDKRIGEVIPVIEKELTYFKGLAMECNEKMRAQSLSKATCVETATDEMDKKKPAQRREFLLKSILKLNLNNPLEQREANEVVFFDAYLKCLLAKAYPKGFSEDGTVLKGSQFNDRDNKYQLVLSALGIFDARKIVFNPELFNPKQLDALFKLDKNPLWLVLKSTIPVSEQFSAEQKISTYIELAQAFFNKQMGATQKYLGAFDMARAAYAIKTTDPEVIQRRDKVFLPFVSVENARDLGKKGQFGNWMVMKPLEHQEPSHSQSIEAELRQLAAKARDVEVLAESTVSPNPTAQKSLLEDLRRSAPLPSSKYQGATQSGFFSRRNKVAPAPGTKKAWPEEPPSPK